MCARLVLNDVAMIEVIKTSVVLHGMAPNRCTPSLQALSVAYNYGRDTIPRNNLFTQRMCNITTRKVLLYVGECNSQHNCILMLPHCVVLDNKAHGTQ